MISKIEDENYTLYGRTKPLPCALEMRMNETITSRQNASTGSAYPSVPMTVPITTKGKFKFLRLVYSVEPMHGKGWLKEILSTLSSEIGQWMWAKTLI